MLIWHFGMGLIFTCFLFLTFSYIWRLICVPWMPVFAEMSGWTRYWSASGTEQSSQSFLCGNKIIVSDCCHCRRKRQWSPNNCSTSSAFSILGTCNACQVNVENLTRAVATLEARVNAIRGPLYFFWVLHFVQVLFYLLDDLNFLFWIKNFLSTKIKK